MTRPSLSPTTVAAIKRDLVDSTPAQVSLKHGVPYYVVQDIHLGRTYTGIRKPSKPRKFTKPRCDRQLDNATVARIRWDLATATTSAVAKKYDLSYATVYHIHTRKTYKDVV